MIPMAKFWLNLALWFLPAVGSTILVRTQPRGGRIAWAIVAAVGFLICADKILDLQMLAYEAGRCTVHALDQGLGLHAAPRAIRVGILSVGAAVVVGFMAWLVRRDRQLSSAKWIALGGIFWIVAYLAIRLLPGARDWFRPPVTWLAEGLGIALVWSGVGLGFRRALARDGRQLRL